MTPALRKLSLTYHVAKADEVQRELSKANCPIARAKLIHSLQWHRSAVNQIDREAQAADRRAV